MIRMLTKTKFFLAIAIAAGLLAGCQQSVPALTAEEEAAFLLKGKTIAQEVSTVMVSAVTNSMATQGVGGAATYCSYVAIPMVDTLAARHGISIKRTSSKIRNPKDAPDEREKVVLARFEGEKAQGMELKPLLEVIDAHTVAYYHPIMMQPLCLSCHGKLGETMEELDYSLIKYLFPEDQAIGYEAGDFRGIMSMKLSR
jgi:hypothetical protein